MEFEDILLDVGDNGKYQKYLILCFLSPAAALIPWCSMSQLFVLSVPDHWCYVPEVALSNLSIAQQRNLTSPPDNPSCKMYDVNYTNLLSSDIYSVPNDSSTIPCAHGWMYDKTNFDYTAGTRWNLVCEYTHLVSLIFTLNNVGSIIGTPIYGALADRIGRKIVFFMTLVVTIVSSLASLFTSDFTTFAVIRTINGTLMPSVFQLAFVIVLELVGPEIRTRLNGLVNCSWAVGFCFLTVVAYLARNWITLGYITSAVPLIFFFYWWFLPESPRWLVSQERYEEAAEIMVNIGRTNGKPQDKAALTQKLEKLGEKMKKEQDVHGAQNSPINLFKYSQLRKIFLIMTICWTASITAYYGLQLNVTNLSGSLFINFFLVTLFEIPGFLTSWYVMERFGRRWCSVTGYILTGAVCMVASIGLQNGDIVCSILGKYFAAATFMAAYQQSSELYPTVIRSQGMGLSITCAFIITFGVPYIVYLRIYGKAIPFITIGATCFIAGAAVSFLPETLNENLPQTIADGQNFGLNHKYFSCKRRQQSAGRERATSLNIQMKSSCSFDSNKRKDSNSRSRSMDIHNTDFDL